jgi:hypothetical protein
MKINRMAMDRLLVRPDGGDASLLYMLLLSNHGHHPGKVFAIAADAMIAAGIIKMERMQLYRARDVLLEECLLVQVRAGRGRHASLFRLTSPMIAAALRERKEKEIGGRKSSITLVSPVRHKGGGSPLILVPPVGHGSVVPA